MELIPAIDLRHGRAVRLRQGDDARATVYGDDPVAVLASYVRAGVARVHVVDLDAALGEPPRAIAAAGFPVREESIREEVE
jgi:phosphoribosylformimino-5-aminoimidazole carboxamide ribotide isomerase